MVNSQHDKDNEIPVEGGDNEPPVLCDRRTCGLVDKKENMDRIMTIIRFLYSLVLLVFSIVIIMAALFTKQTTATEDDGVNPVLAFFIFWFLIIWLATMEGSQGCLVGLQPIEKEKYAETHPRALQSTIMCQKGNNMERFIVGRQFLVVLVVFSSSFLATSVPGAEVLGLPESVCHVFLGSGVALILTAIILGQLSAQVVAASCMLDFINNYFMLYFVTYTSLAVEMSGLLHSVYLLQIVFSKFAGESSSSSSVEELSSSKSQRTNLQRGFFWGRVLLSLCLLAFAFAVTLTALFDGTITVWDGVSPAVSVVIFFLLMCFLGIMEGMHIALFAVVDLPEEDLKSHALTYGNCELAFRDQNLQAFLIGRQICITICMFVVARISTIKIEVGQGENIFGVSDGVQSFFNTGLLGVMITTIAASFVWRIIASWFPIAFLSNPLIYLIILLCLLLEASGICSVAWLLASIFTQISRFQPDEVYFGTPEERAAPKNAPSPDHDLELEETESAGRPASKNAPLFGDDLEHEKIEFVGRPASKNAPLFDDDLEHEETS